MILCDRCDACYHRDGAMRVDSNYGSTIGYEPNYKQEWAEQPDYSEPPLRINGNGDNFDHRADEDYFSQAAVAVLQ